MHPIRSVVVWVGDKRHQYELGDEKGPNIDGVRGVICEISERLHDSGAEYTIWVSNSGITREWCKVSGHDYHTVNNIKSELP
jgi:hypothetical protein